MLTLNGHRPAGRCLFRSCVLQAAMKEPATAFAMPVLIMDRFRLKLAIHPMALPGLSRTCSRLSIAGLAGSP